MTTYFVGSHYEVTGSTVTKYYFASASRIAMRTGSTLSYLLTDHLGSTSITTNSAGAPVSELRYKPWGEVRYSNGTTSTKYTFTGQFSNTSEFGLMYYGARWYDPALSRFTQADSIVPGGVQGLDRYAYVNNSPVRYTDPTGHWIETALDIAFIGYDIYDISSNGLNWENGLSLVADVASAALPIVTGGGLAVRALMHADDAVDAVKVVNAIDNAVDTAKAVENAVDTAKAVENGVDLANAVDNAADAAKTTENAGITILGYSEDVRDYNGVDVKKLVDQPNWTWDEMNIPFLDDAMARGDTFVYVSDYTKFDKRVFNREIKYLTEKGYDRIIDMFHPR